MSLIWSIFEDEYCYCDYDKPCEYEDCQCEENMVAVKMNHVIVNWVNLVNMKIVKVKKIWLR